MTTKYCEYYKTYIGPPIKIAYIGISEWSHNIRLGFTNEIDVTCEIIDLYGKDCNWNMNLYTADILQKPEYIGKTLYIEFDKYNPHFPNHIEYTFILLERNNTVINSPLSMPFQIKKAVV